MPSTRRTIGASTYNGGFDFDADFSKLRSRKKLCFFPKSRKKNAQRVQEQETTTLISGMDAAETLRKRAEDEEREQTATKKEQQQRQARGFHRVQEELFFKDEHFVPLEEETNIDTTSKSTDNQEIPERLQRPIDPPDILAELHGLPLVGFEKVAEERAVALVSTWLFDNGLLDELMDHGGMRKSTVLSSNQSVVSTGDSVRTSEGIELGVVSGLPVEGVSKLDYHISSLMASTQRKLAFYNSQLSDGHIVPTGDEIRELVQAIHHNDQDDIGRLGELSTYLHYQHGGVEDSQLLANYPKLKQAHNARRNLKKCFQELELFYTQIPDTCQHLRLKLQTSRGDPFAIRDVCSDCVDLEAFLLEVEVGMKLRTEKGIYQQQRWRRFDDTRLRQRILHNHNRINSFLFRRAKDVWDLVGEIRRAIIAGIGRTFERAMQNHPEELKALVEAVELHEALRGKFKTEHGKNPSRLVDIRCTALKHLNEYFEQRGIKVFWAEYERVCDVYALCYVLSCPVLSCFDLI